ncbi:MAG: bile acid:sodium symporter [Gammaproteobacteria bacterium]
MIIDIFVPAIVILLMMVAGTDVQIQQFVMILRSRLVLIGGTFAQALLLPLCAVTLVTVMRPAPELAAGLVLVAASPGGALSNFYCYLGRLNVSLSLMLTACSNLASFAVLPALLAISLPSIVPGWDVDIPFGELMSRLARFLLLPAAIGVTIRRLVPDLVTRYADLIRSSSLFLLLLLIGLITFDQWEVVREIYLDATIVTVLFTALAVVVGLLAGFVLRMGASDRYVLSIEFAVRNVGAAALVASSTLNRPEFLAFGALFVVVQFPLVMLLMKTRTKRGAPSATDG